MSQTITADKPRRIKPTTLAAIGFAAPLIIYMLIFYVWPLIQNISMSMHRYTRRTFVTGDAPWSGFDIYKEILSNQQFWTILGQTLIFVFASIVFQYSIGLALAVFFNQNFKLSAALRGAFLVPWLLPPMISGTIWQWMMDADSGVINNYGKYFTAGGFELFIVSSVMHIYAITSGVMEKIVMNALFIVILFHVADKSRHACRTIQ